MQALSIRLTCRLLIFLGAGFLPLCAFAQGGPPMITDDPETPGNGKWEINIAGIFERVPGSRTLEAPALDLNYGWGDHIQLKLEGAFVTLDERGRGVVAGLGNAEAGVKWRFLDEAKAGLSVSIYPQFEWNLARASSRRGLSERGEHLLLPMEVARKIGWLELTAEVGDVIDFDGANEWFYGLLGAVSVTKTLELMAELHGVTQGRGTGHELTVNIGARQELSEHITLLASLGHDVHASSGEDRRLIGYFGLQFNY